MSIVEGNVNLVVAKICHEMANYLSILNFIKEDIADNATNDIREMLKIIELLAGTMDFFRNIYSDSSDTESLINTVKKIYLLKDVKLQFPCETIYSIPEKVKNALCGILYTIVKSSRPGDVVTVSGSTHKILIDMPKNRAFPIEVRNALSHDAIKDNVFNILVNHAKRLANSEGYEIKLSFDLKQVVIWNR